MSPIDIILMWLNDCNNSKFWTITTKPAYDYDICIMSKQLKWDVNVSVAIVIPRDINVWNDKLSDPTFFEKLHGMITNSMRVAFKNAYDKMRGAYV